LVSLDWYYLVSFGLSQWRFLFPSLGLGHLLPVSFWMFSRIFFFVSFLFLACWLYVYCFCLMVSLQSISIYLNYFSFFSPFASQIRWYVTTSLRVHSSFFLCLSSLLLNLSTEFLNSVIVLFRSVIFVWYFFILSLC
jgi:hypothetical protein